MTADRPKLRLLPPIAYPPPARAALLMCAVTLEEIRIAGQKLGLTFREAYAERAGLYRRPTYEWPEIMRPRSEESRS